MLIYNVTTNIEDSIHDEWLRWMRKTHIPDVLATGKFLNAKMTRVLVEEEMGGTTYSVQFTVLNRETLQRYYEEEAPRLRDDAHRLFKGKFVSFRTELEIVSEHTVDSTNATQYLFAYGTLRQQEVQNAIFSKVLEGNQEALPYYKMSAQKVADTYPNIVASENPKDKVKGMVYVLTDEELLKADAYEGSAYLRTEAVLESGKKAWVYLSTDY